MAVQNIVVYVNVTLVLCCRGKVIKVDKTMEEEDFELPNVNMGSPSRSSALRRPHLRPILPNPIELAAQRKQLQESRESAKQILENYLQLDLNAMEVDSLASQEDINSDSIKTETYTECNGIELTEFNYERLKRCLTESQISFVKNLIYKMMESPDRLNFLIVLHEKLTKMVLNSPIITFEDTVCYVIICCLMLLNNKTRNIDKYIEWDRLMCSIINKVPFKMQHHEFLNGMSNLIMDQFEHYKDRFYIGERFHMKATASINLPTDPRYYCSRLSQLLHQKTLHELIGYKYGCEPIPNTFAHLKRLMSKGSRKDILDRYEKYTVIRLLNALSMTIEPVNNEKEEKAKIWLLRYFSSLDRINEDFAVRMLSVCVRSIWSDKSLPI